MGEGETVADLGEWQWSQNILDCDHQTVLIVYLIYIYSFVEIFVRFGEEIFVARFGSGDVVFQFWQPTAVRLSVAWWQGNVKTHSQFKITWCVT
jgi:hypothetical protein